MESKQTDSGKQVVLQQEISGAVFERSEAKGIPEDGTPIPPAALRSKNLRIYRDPHFLLMEAW